MPENDAAFLLSPNELFYNNPLPMWVYDVQTLRFLEVNTAAVVRYGYSRDEFLTLCITDIRPPEDVPRLLEDVAHERSDFKISGEWRHRTKNGQVFDADIVSHTVEFAGRPAAWAVVRDITERKQAETALQRAYAEAERRVRQLEALSEIDLAIRNSLDLRITLNVFLDEVTTYLGVDAACVLLANAQTRTLRHAAGRGFRTAVLQHANLRFGQGHGGRTALEQRPLYIPDLRVSPDDFVRMAAIREEGFIAYYAVPLVAKGETNGVLEIFHRAPLSPDAAWTEFLVTLADQAAIAIDNATLLGGLRRSNADLAIAYDATLEGWSRALDMRDRETEGHSRRVTEMAVQLARALGMGEQDVVHLRRGALLHDIGKMGVPDAILAKAAPLTEDEWKIMRRHPEYAYELLSPIEYLRPALDIPYCHHEKWDGTGYPRGLSGEQIPLAARIFAVADVWDALRSARPYRQAWTEAKTREFIRSQAGQHFDPRAVEALLAQRLLVASSCDCFKTASTDGGGRLSQGVRGPGEPEIEAPRADSRAPQAG